MSDFQFRLENLLEHRAETEALAAGRLAEAQLEADEAERAWTALEEAHRSAREALGELQRAGSDAGRMQTVRLVLERLETGIERATEALDTARDRLARKRADYQRANRDRRALEELKDKRRDAWDRDAARRDQRDMDEVAANRHVRAQRGGAT